jgi:hypothetical protein
MLYSVSYKNKIKYPYEDWLDRKHDVIFVYSEHRCQNFMRYFYIPQLSTLYLDIDFEYYVFKASCQIQIINKIVTIIGVSCQNENIWPEIQRHPASASGGVRYFKKHLKIFRTAPILENFRNQMFGPEYTLCFSKKATMIPLDTFEFDYKAYESNIWNVCIGTYDTTRDEAATLIQSKFRGWRVRIMYRYNPYTSLGRYVIGKLFRENLNN